MKIGIITIHNAYNYGSTLQAYALQNFLITNGFNVDIIDYQNKQLENVYRGWKIAKKTIFKRFLKLQIRSGICELLERKKSLGANKYYLIHKSYDKYRRSFLKLSNRIKPNKLEALNSYDVLICGSDQVWNNGITGGDNIYYLSVPNYTGRKIAYAVSGKLINVGDDEIRKIREIEFISTRENQLKEELEKYNFKDVSVVLDPTFLIDKRLWEKQVHPTLNKYIFAYLVWDEKYLIDYIKRLSQEKNMPYLILHRIGNYFEIGGRKISSSTPSDFLSLIANADYVISNSFHGTVFSLIFRKKFFSHNSGDRVSELLCKLKMEDRLVTNQHIGDIDEPIDWDKYDSIIQGELNKSKDFLLNALK